VWNLGSVEAEVMERIRSNEEPVAVRDVAGEVDSVRAQPLACSTVMTTMYKLFRKGWLERGRSGKRYFYAPVEARDACVARLMAQVLGTSAGPEVALLHFVEGLGSEGSTALRSALHRLPAEGGLRRMIRLTLLGRLFGGVRDLGSVGAVPGRVGLAFPSCGHRAPGGLGGGGSGRSGGMRSDDRAVRAMACRRPRLGLDTAP
jgi:predicted transcriptional regulator